MLHHTRYNLMRKRTKILAQAVTDMLNNWDNNQMVDTICRNALTAVKWAAPTKQCTLTLRQPHTAPVSHKPHQLKLF